MLFYQLCDCYTEEVGQAYPVSDLPKLQFRKCLFNGFQLAWSFLFFLPFFSFFHFQLSLLTGIPDLVIPRPALSPMPLHASPAPNSG